MANDRDIKYGLSITNKQQLSESNSYGVSKASQESFKKQLKDEEELYKKQLDLYEAISTNNLNKLNKIAGDFLKVLTSFQGNSNNLGSGTIIDDDYKEVSDGVRDVANVISTVVEPIRLLGTSLGTTSLAVIESKKAFEVATQSVTTTSLAVNESKKAFEEATQSMDDFATQTDATTEKVQDADGFDEAAKGVEQVTSFFDTLLESSDEAERRRFEYLSETEQDAIRGWMDKANDDIEKYQSEIDKLNALKENGEYDKLSKSDQKDIDNTIDYYSKLVKGQTSIGETLDYIQDRNALTSFKKNDLEYERKNEELQEELKKAKSSVVYGNDEDYTLKGGQDYIKTVTNAILLNDRKNRENQIEKDAEKDKYKYESGSYAKAIAESRREELEKKIDEGTATDEESKLFEKTDDKFETWGRSVGDSIGKQLLGSGFGEVSKSISTMSKSMKLIDASNLAEKESLEKELANKVENGEISQEDADKQLADLEKQQEEDKEKARKDLLSKILESVNNIGDALVSAAEEVANSSASQIENALTGTGKKWEDFEQTIQDNLALSSIVKATDVIAQATKLATENGIGYNVEHRAYIQTMANQIVSSFSATDKNLTRLIRMTNTDITEWRAGLQALLQQEFNALFEDTSYLVDSLSTISSNIFEATALMSADMGTQFEYVTQEYLGAMYESGVSENLINKISQGLGYLGSGNISSIESDSQLLNLFAMAIARSNELSWGEILINGLDVETTQELLVSMIGYLQEVADNTSENNLVRSAFASVFGFSTSDLEAMSNVTSVLNDLASVSSVTSGDLMSYFESRIDDLYHTQTFSTQMQNFASNLQYSIGSNIVNTFMYIPYKILGLLQDEAGGVINIGTMFTGTLGSVSSLGRAALTAVSTLATLVEGITNLTSEGDSMSTWGATQYRTLGGSGLSVTGTGSTSLASLGSSGNSDEATKEMTKDSAKEMSSDYSIADEEDVDLNDLFYALFHSASEQGVLDDLGTILMQIMQRDYINVKIVEGEVMPVAFSDSSMQTSLKNIEKGLGVEQTVQNQEESVRGILSNMNKGMTTSEDGKAALNVNLSSSDITLFDMMGVGAKVNKLDLGGTK